MEKIKDKQIELDGVIIPFCEEGGEHWYPIRYVTEKFLLKGSPQLHKNDLYKSYIKKLMVDWTFKGTTPQEGNCMNKEGWIIYLGNCKSNKNRTLDKVKRHNTLCGYFKCEYEKIIEWNNNDNLYDDYVKDCISAYEQEHDNIEYGICSNCGRRLPLASGFFPPDNRVLTGFTSRCNMCKSSNYPISHVDTYARRVYSLYGNDAYLMYINNPSQFIVEYGMNKDFNKLNLHTNTTSYIKIAEKEALLNIVKNDYVNSVITVNDLNLEFVKTKYRIKIKYDRLTNNEINEYCSDNDCKIRPWKYKYYKLGAISLQEGFNILKTYIEDNQIEINNILEYTKYEQMLKNSKLTQFLSGKSVHKISSLEFIVKYYNNTYAGYKFKLKSANYYKEKDNMMFDMKWYIENDLKIPIEKIPLYVTKWSLHQNASPLYNALYKKMNYNTLFEWINNCYPNKFIELDFDMNPYRSNFDSLEEAQVDEQIRSKLGNIIHNERNKPDTVIINGMTPDWIVCSNKGIYLAEYWGMYTTTDISKSTGVQYYMNKMKKKYKKYGELMKVGYKHLYVYPYDLKNNFEGLHKKLNSIIK